MNYHLARVISIENNYIKIRGYLDNESKRRLLKECDIKEITTDDLVITNIRSASDAFSDINLVEKLEILVFHLVKIIRLFIHRQTL